VRPAAASLLHSHLHREDASWRNAVVRRSTEASERERLRELLAGSPLALLNAGSIDANGRSERKD